MKKLMTESTVIFWKKMLNSRGFGSKWINWILKLVKGGSICISLNNENTPYFSIGKGLRQGNPLSHLLFLT
jgi:hypothetical protein